jgi:NAD(P)-dependent dehydrogenase (short-subunit alcohol dehydrogenase family)
MTVSGDQPGQEQQYPGHTGEMTPDPNDEMRGYEGRALLAGRIALVTGGDSGIGRAVAVAFAKEGADVAIAYLSEHEDAEHTAKVVSETGRRCLPIAADLGQERNCRDVVERSVRELGGLDILVNNVAFQQPQESLEDITTEQWERTLRTNIHSYFWVTKAALPHIPEDGRGAIVNTSSINGLRGNKQLIDYSATKGAILALTYALAQALVSRHIRVNVLMVALPSSLAPQATYAALRGGRSPTPLARRLAAPWHRARCGRRSSRRRSQGRRSAASVGRCRCNAPPSRTRSPRRTCSSPPSGCRATTPARCWPQRGAKRCLADPVGTRM